MSSFESKLASLIAREANAARCDSERMSMLIRRLAGALGLVVAIAADGDGELIDILITRAEALALEEAVMRSPLIASLRELGT